MAAKNGATKGNGSQIDSDQEDPWEIERQVRGEQT
jgi:hypothetical protein